MYGLRWHNFVSWFLVHYPIRDLQKRLGLLKHVRSRNIHKSINTERIPTQQWLNSGNMKSRLILINQFMCHAYDIMMFKSLNKVNVGNLSLGCAFIMKWAHAWLHMLYCQGSEQSGKFITQVLWQLRTWRTSHPHTYPP